ncbi:MAG: SpoIIE family protein phosphatase [Deltaproteobacteria bacterium]|nr:SpoIIE family protein phosphatase [Deltaproteobacteria bacterium]MBI3294340.1 SpoIIE family protein phosphatase [Deltaproteobacteria bacterium]
MKIYALNLSLPTPLKDLLAAQRYSLIHTFPSQIDKKAVLALFGVARPADLAKVAILRESLPKAWIVLVAPDRWLTQPERVTDLIQLKEKSDVCTLSQWQTRFWFLLQAALNHHRLLQKVRTLTKESKILTANMQAITDRTNQLVGLLENNLQLAENVQRSLLPKYTPDIPGISLSVKYLPAQGIGGDYYDIFEFGDRKRFGFLLADSKSHGLAAALLSVLLKVRLEEMKERFPDSRSFVDFLAHELAQGTRREPATLNLLYGILDRTNLHFEFTAAGPIAPTLVRNGTPEVMSAPHNPPLGEVTNYRYQQTHVTLKPGDLLLLHTDGLSPLLPPKSLSDLIRTVCKASPTPDGLSIQNEILGRIRAANSKGALKDDITLIHLSVVDNVLYLASHSK